MLQALACKLLKERLMNSAGVDLPAVAKPAKEGSGLGVPSPGSVSNREPAVFEISLLLGVGSLIYLRAQAARRVR